MRRDHFDSGNKRKDSHGNCTHCGEGLGSGGTMRRGGDMFDAEGAQVYTKRKDSAYSHDEGSGDYTHYKPGKYCPGCASNAEKAERD